MKLLGKLYCNYTVANIYIGNCSSKWSISSTCSSNCFQQNFSNLYSTQIFMSKVAGLKIYYCRKWHPGCLRHGWCRQKIVWHFGLFRSPGIKFPQHFEFKIICIFNKKVSQIFFWELPKKTSNSEHEWTSVRYLIILHHNRRSLGIIWTYYVWLLPSKTTMSTCRNSKLICMQKMNSILNFLFEILYGYCKLIILSTLRMIDHTHQLW